MRRNKDKKLRQNLLHALSHTKDLEVTIEGSDVMLHGPWADVLLWKNKLKGLDVDFEYDGTLGSTSTLYFKLPGGK